MPEIRRPEKAAKEIESRPEKSVKIKKNGPTVRRRKRWRMQAEVWEDLLFPRRCPVCDRPVRPFGALICEECASELKRIGEPRCLKCGKPLCRDGEEYCSDCRQYPHVFRRGFSLYPYRSVSGAIGRLKYGGRREYAEFFGQGMADELQTLWGEGLLPWPDLLIPVPASKARLKKRGYNQAELIAEKMSGLTGITMRNDILFRSEDTPPLKGMTAAMRHKILKSAFNACGNDVKFKLIMLIDDIYTTGATIDACSRALLQSGASAVFFMTLAVGEDLTC